MRDSFTTGVRADDQRTLAGQAFTQLYRDLIANRFKPGERLRFHKIREIYQVGVAPLREALSRLSGAGLVVQVGQKGFRVAPVSVKDLQDVVETRGLVEIRAVQDAVTSGDEEWEASLVAAFYRLSKVTRPAPESAVERAVWEEHHTNFHQALVAGCANRRLLQVWSTIFAQAERYRRLAIEVGHWAPNELETHEDLLNAALARDSDKIAGLLHQHIASSSEHLIAQVNSLVDASGNYREAVSQLGIADDEQPNGRAAI